MPNHFAPRATFTYSVQPSEMASTEWELVVEIDDVESEDASHVLFLPMNRSHADALRTELESVLSG
jgi:hypothetical protein